MTPERMLQQAIDAAALGLHVIPICDGAKGKLPAVKWKRFQTEQPSVELMTDWAEKFGDKVIGWGCITGAGSGIFTIDADGEEGLATLAAIGLVPVLRTKHGGGHVHGVHPGGETQIKTVARFGHETFPMLDVRGDGGYSMVVNPSYTWVSDFEPLAWEEFPPELRAAVTKGARPERKKAQKAAASFEEGGRNEALFEAGCGRRRKGDDAESIYLYLLGLNAEKCKPPLDEAEVATIAASAAEEPVGEDTDGIGPTPEEPVDGAALIESLIAFQSRYLIVSPEAKLVAAFWILHTHAIGAAHYTPYIIAESPVRRCAKSLYLDLLALFVRKPLLAADITVAGLFRKTEPTLSVFLDEQDGLGEEDIRKYLNAGFQRGRKVVRADNDRGARATADFEPFSPKMLATIGGMPDTIEDRAIVFKMRRKLKHESVERFRLRKVKVLAQPLRERAAWWGEQNIEALRDAEPALPDALDDRAQDIAEPLLAIAESIGGDWPERLSKAIVALRNGSSSDDGDEKTRLLADLKVIFDNVSVDPEHFISSKALVWSLTRDDSPWRERGPRAQPLTATAMGNMLKSFGIRSLQHRTDDGERHRGYFRRQFEDTWGMYLAGKTEGDNDATATDSTRASEPETLSSKPKGTEARVESPPVDADGERFAAEQYAGIREKWEDARTNGSEPSADLEGVLLSKAEQS